MVVLLKYFGFGAGGQNIFDNTRELLKNWAWRGWAIFLTTPRRKIGFGAGGQFFKPWGMVGGNFNLFGSLVGFFGAWLNKKNEKN